MKQVILIRNDLKLPKGKLAVQVSHASVASLVKSHKDDIKKWQDQGQKKVVLKVAGMDDFNDIVIKLEKKKIPYFLVRDAGLTQLSPGTATALGIGPVLSREIDEITGDLKLL